MGNRLYTTAVVAFWLASMGWLLTSRILPPFLGGDAPSSSLAYQVRPVAWRIELDGVACGQAVLQAIEGDGGVREVHSTLKLTRIPTPERAPLWMKPMLSSLENLSLEMRTQTTFDSLNELSAFKTKMVVNQLETPVQLIGRVYKDVMKLQVRVGTIVHRIEKPWSSNASLTGELTPASRLLPLWQGRRWSQEVYNPFSSPNAPLELLEAEVREQVRMTHDGLNMDVWVVEYREVEKAGSTDQSRLRRRLYVNELGWILKQEAFLFGSSVALYREGEEESSALASEMLSLDVGFSDSGSTESTAADKASPAAIRDSGS